jgi:hypothetical protein
VQRAVLAVAGNTRLTTALRALRFETQTNRVALVVLHEALTPTSTTTQTAAIARPFLIGGTK